MSKRHPNPRLVKIHRSYTVEETATVCGVHRNTVRQWIKTGLRTLDTRRPVLMQGGAFGSFWRDGVTKTSALAYRDRCTACVAVRHSTQRRTWPTTRH